MLQLTLSPWRDLLLSWDYIIMSLSSYVHRPRVSCENNDYNNDIDNDGETDDLHHH